MCGCILRWQSVAYTFWVTVTLALTADPVKNQLFQSMVMLHFKLMGMKCTTTYKQKLYPLVLSSKHFSSESGPVGYEMNRQVGHAHTMVIYTMGGLGVMEVLFNPAGDSCIAYQYSMLPLFCFAVLCVLSSFAIISLRVRELVCFSFVLF